MEFTSPAFRYLLNRWVVRRSGSTAPARSIQTGCWWCLDLPHPPRMLDTPALIAAACGRPCEISSGARHSPNARHNRFPRYSSFNLHWVFADFTLLTVLFTGLPLCACACPSHSQVVLVRALSAPSCCCLVQVSRLPQVLSTGQGPLLLETARGFANNDL